MNPLFDFMNTSKWVMLIIIASVILLVIIIVAVFFIVRSKRRRYLIYGSKIKTKKIKRKRLKRKDFPFENAKQVYETSDAGGRLKMFRHYSKFCDPISLENMEDDINFSDDNNKDEKTANPKIIIKRRKIR